MARQLPVLWHPMPDDRTPSPYIHRLAAALGDHGIEIERLTPPALVRGPQVVHVHWPENLIRSGGGWARRGLSAGWATAVLAGLRRRAVKVVYTAHNLEPHDGFRGRLDARAYRWFLDTVDVVICHQAGDRDRVLDRWTFDPAPRFETIEHGPLPLGPARDAAPPGPPHLVALGRIGPYKQLDELVREWPTGPSPAELHIGGSVLDVDLADRLERAALVDSRLSVEIGHLDDHRFHQLLVGAHGAFALQRDGLTSGAAVAALSHDVPVIVSPGNQADELRRRHGPGWVHVLESLDAAQVADAVRWAAGDHAGPRPSEQSPGWDDLAAATAEVYRSLASG